MKKYNVNDLKVVKVEHGDSCRYLICKYNEFTDSYIEVFTNEKIKISDRNFVEPLSNYFSVLSLYNYTTGKPLMLSKKELLQIYINKAVNLFYAEQQNENRENKCCNIIEQALEKATLAFFPKEGRWTIGCFDRSTELSMQNLPYNSRNDVWLATMLKKEQKLYRISDGQVLEFVRTSNFFQEKRHEYELEIVRQVLWTEFDSDFVYLNPDVDLCVRKDVVDTLYKIGLDIDVIEESLERFAYLWREHFMEQAFKNEYRPICYAHLEPVEEEHKEKWLKMRRYEYYQRHKESVDLYGTVLPDMLMSKDEVAQLKDYLDKKNSERKQYLEDAKKQIPSFVKKI